MLRQTTIPNSNVSLEQRGGALRIQDKCTKVYIMKQREFIMNKTLVMVPDPL